MLWPCDLQAVLLHASHQSARLTADALLPAAGERGWSGTQCQVRSAAVACCSRSMLTCQHALSKPPACACKSDQRFFAMLLTESGCGVRRELLHLWEEQQADGQV